MPPKSTCSQSLKEESDLMILANKFFSKEKSPYCQSISQEPGAASPTGVATTQQAPSPEAGARLESQAPCCTAVAKPRLSAAARTVSTASAGASPFA